MLRVVDSLSMPGGAKPNEDYIFTSDRCLAVLDGATNLVGSPYGADVFVHDFARIFAEAVRRLPLYAAVNEAIAVLKTRRFGAHPLPADVSLYASAAAVFVCEAEDELHLLTLGDCAAYLQTRDGFRKVFSPALDDIDDTVLCRLSELHRTTGKDVRDLMTSPEIKAMLVANRRRMNAPGGYRSLSFNLSPLCEADIVKFPLSDVCGGVLFSDGFQLVESDILAHTPFDALYAHLRALEASDPAYNRFPRFKHGDDASILSFRVE